MNKIVQKEFRSTKEFTLPTSKLTLVCYPSLLVGDLDEKTSGDASSISLIVKLIKEWNLYGAETDANPLPITSENLNKIPATDFEYLLEGIKQFSADQKKS